MWLRSLHLHLKPPDTTSLTFISNKVFQIVFEKHCFNQTTLVFFHFVCFLFFGVLSSEFYTCSTSVFWLSAGDSWVIASCTYITCKSWFQWPMKTTEPEIEYPIKSTQPHIEQPIGTRHFKFGNKSMAGAYLVSIIRLLRLFRVVGSSPHWAYLFSPEC
jgi:hypothetical protein